MTDRPDASIEPSLRSEIVESQKSQVDLLKWKLVAAAALGALALTPRGEVSIVSAEMRLLLCFVPLVCVYVDLISVHLMLRMVVIGTYLRLSKAPSGSDVLDYESWLAQVRYRRHGDPLAFEVLALHGSSFLFSALVLVAGFVLDLPEPRYSYLFLLSGLLGIAVTAALVLTFPARVRRIAEVPVTSRHQPSAPAPGAPTDPSPAA